MNKRFGLFIGMYFCSCFLAVRGSLDLEPSFAHPALCFDLKARLNLDGHQAIIQEDRRAGMKSAAAEIERIIRRSGVDTARARFQELRAPGEREFYVDEKEFNALGYKFLFQENKTPKAIAVFEMNTKAFPESWNVWDSLGEAFLSQNERDKAEACYVKSLELNPDSENGKNSLSHIRGDKLDFEGQTKETAKFAPGLVSTAGNFEFSIAFTADGREVYFTRRKDPGWVNTMMVCRQEKDGWTAPQEAEFCKGFPSNEPHITPDGNKLYFGCQRQRPGAAQAEYGIWVTERKESGWGEPRYHGPGMYVSSTLKGDLYMTDITNVAGGGLIKYPLASGVLGSPLRLPRAVNEPVPVAHAFIAPDENYIVFDSYFRPGSQGGEGDLYVVFRNPDGTWSEAASLGDAVNTPGTNFCAMVTPDGKYLFYSTCRDIYWVSTEVIHRLRTRSGPSAAAADEILSSVLSSGNLARLQLLVEKDPALLKARDSRGRTPLHVAAASGRPEMVRWLIDRGAEVAARTAEEETPLMMAALSGNKDVIRLLIEKGAYLNAKNSYQRTALVLVARERGDAGMAALLLDSSADIEASDRYNDTALTLAAWRGFADLVGLLLERGAQLPAQPGQKQQLLIQAVSTGIDKLFDRLMAEGLDLSIEDGLGGNLLHAAANGGSGHIMKALIERSFDVNLKDRNGWTPLHRAAERGRLSAAALLIERGAELNERTLAGETPFNLAAAESNTEVANLFKSKGADQSPPAFPKLMGEYLGQKKPVEKPELFAPGIVSGRFGLHCAAVFSPDSREVYWNLMIEDRTSGYSTGRLLVSRLVDGRWTYPEIASFTRGGKDADVPFFSPDGRRLYFMSRMALPGSTQESGEHIWFMERKGTGWSEARPVDEVVNSLPQHWQFSVDQDYNLYFSTTITGGQGRGDIYCSKYMDGRYTAPQNLGGQVNTTGGEGMPFIAPDGSYLLFQRNLDLYICFRAKDGSWTEAVSLGPSVNSPDNDLCPIVSADGKYLFFLSGRSGESHTWWVEAKVIEGLRLKERSPLQDSQRFWAARFERLRLPAREYF